MGVSILDAVSTVVGIQSSTNTLVNSYNAVRGTLSGLTGGLVNLPSASSALSKIAGNSSTLSTILEVIGLSGYIGDTAHVVISSANVEDGAFKWTEMPTTPDSFATPESTMIFAGEPIYANNTTGIEFIPIGACQGFSFSSGITVTPVKELRCEETYIIPGKSSPGNLQLSRFFGDYSSLGYRVHNVSGKGFNTQGGKLKPLFGLLVMFLSPSRKNTIVQLYFERCAINTVGMSIQAGQYSILENLNITYGKCITVGEDTISSTVDTTNATTLLTNLVSKAVQNGTKTTSS